MRWFGDSLKRFGCLVLDDGFEGCFSAEAFEPLGEIAAAAAARPRLPLLPAYRAPNALAPAYGRGRQALTAADFLDSYATPNALAPFHSAFDQVWNPPATVGGVFGALGRSRLK